MLCVHLELSLEDSWNTHRLHGHHTLHPLWISVLLNSILCLDKSTLSISFCSLYYRWFRLRLLNVTYTIYIAHFTLYFTLCTQTPCKLHSTHWPHVGWNTVLQPNLRRGDTPGGVHLHSHFQLSDLKYDQFLPRQKKKNIWIVIGCFYYFWLLVINWLTDWLVR